MGGLVLRVYQMCDIWVTNTHGTGYLGGKVMGCGILRSDKMGYRVGKTIIFTIFSVHWRHS